MKLARAGHPPVYHLRAVDNSLQVLSPRGTIISALVSGVRNEHETELARGDRLILYTDGIIETPDKNGQEFGDDRLMEFVKEKSSFGPQGFIDILLERLQEWSGTTSVEDDITIVVVDIE